MDMKLNKLRDIVSSRTGKPGELQSMGSQGVGHDLTTEQQSLWTVSLPGPSPYTYSFLTEIHNMTKIMVCSKSTWLHFLSPKGIECIYTVMRFHKTEIHSGCPNSVTEILSIVQIKNFRMGENNSKWSNWQTTNLKNIQATPTAQFQKNNWPNQKMGQRTK